MLALLRFRDSSKRHFRRVIGSQVLLRRFQALILLVLADSMPDNKTSGKQNVECNTAYTISISVRIEVRERQEKTLTG